MMQRADFQLAAMLASLSIATGASFGQAEFRGLGTLSASEVVDSHAAAVSADGSTIVGFVRWWPGGTFYSAVRWTPSEGMRDLFAQLPAGEYAAAMGCNADGSIVVGDTQDPTHAEFASFMWSTGQGTTIVGAGDSGHTA